MGMLKRIERNGKRLLVHATTSLVKTQSLAKEQILAESPRRILVVRQQNQMGDMLLAVPAFRAIKKRFPDATIGVVTAPINRDVSLLNPYVSQVFTFGGVNPFQIASLARRIRGERYDLAIVLHTVSFSFTSAMIGLVSGARFRVGSTSMPFGNRMSEAFYHLELPLPKEDELRTMNEAEHNLYPLCALGINTDDIAPVLVPSDESSGWAAGFLEESFDERPVLAVHPGAGKTENVWPPSRLAEVVDGLTSKLEMNLLVLQGPRDARHVENFLKAATSRAHVLRGRSIGDVAAVLKRVALVLCNDTGIMHVSSAVGATTLAIFGPTDPHRWAPRCPSLHIVRAEDGTLASLTAQTVYEKALEILESMPSRLELRAGEESAERTVGGNERGSL